VWGVNSAYGLALTSGIGLLLLAMRIATSVVQATDPNKSFNVFYWVQKIIAPIPSVLKPLVAVKGQPDGVIAGALLLRVDVGPDIANGASGYIEDIV
jgi:hypothetical protein